MLPALLKVITIWLIFASYAFSADNPLLIKNDFTAKQRNLFIEAKQAFKDNHPKKYRRLKTQLRDYPLYPYLEYSEINQDLNAYLAKYRSTKPHSTKAKKALEYQIGAFITTQGNSHLSRKLLRKWLTHLAATKNWGEYKRYYRPYVKKVALECFNLRAKINTGEAFPKEAIQALWLTAKSQPDECDPVFIHWEDKGYLTQDLLWQRHKLVVNKKKYQLAIYLQKKMDASHRYLADLYLNIHKNPSKINNVKLLPSLPPHADSATTQKVNDIIYNGLYRYAYSEPLKSLSLFNRLTQSYPFNEQERIQLKKRMASRLIRKDNITDPLPTLKSIPKADRVDEVERLLRKYLALQEWQNVHDWIQLLPEKEVSSDRWQYWQARALEELQKTGKKNDHSPSTHEIFTALSSSRSFYGFLSADKLNTPYQLEDKPAPIDLTVIQNVSQYPAIQRAKELFLLGDMYVARTEWRFAVQGFSMQEYIAAGQLAHTWGWNRKAIEAMAGARYWDDLTIRFPVVHDNIIRHKAKKNNISSSLIFSIARQESAWEFDARSRVGARGLMQIMPATARETAKKAKIRYSKKKLFDPEYNITLGSHYISGLLKRYDNHRALAIASYNAGPHRVKGWLAKS
jgi:soluble lytic murein transglycosylase